MRTNPAFTLATVGLIAVSAYFLYLSTISPYQECHGKILHTEDDITQKGPFEAVVHYGVSDLDQKVGLRVYGDRGQEYIFEDDATIKSCIDEDKGGGNILCNQKYSDGFLYGIMGVISVVFLCMVAQYVVPDDMSYIPFYALHFLMFVFFLLTLIRTIIVQETMGKHAEDDLAALFDNSTTPFADETFLMSVEKHSCESDSGIVWTWISFVAGTAACIVYGTGIWFIMGAPALGGETATYTADGGKVVRTNYRIFAIIVTVLLAPTFLGAVGVDKFYGTYEQNLENSGIALNKDIDCKYDNHWEVGRRGVVFTKTTSGLGNFTAKPRFSLLAERMAAGPMFTDTPLHYLNAATPDDGVAVALSAETAADAYDAADPGMKLLAGLGVAIKKSIDSHYGGEYSAGGGGKLLTIWANVSDFTGPGCAPENYVCAEKIEKMNPSKAPHGFNARMTLKALDNADQRLPAAAAMLTLCMAKGVACPRGAPLAGLVTVNMTALADFDDAQMFALALHGSVPGTPGRDSLPECSLWDYNFNVQTPFKDESCNFADDETDNCMKAVCSTRHIEQWYLFLAFVLIPLVVTYLWSVNWAIDHDEFWKWRSHLLSLAAFAPVLGLLVASVFYKTNAKDYNECSRKQLDYFTGEATGYDTGSDSFSSIGVDWERHEPRQHLLIWAFVLYAIIMVGVHCLIFVAEEGGKNVASSMSHLEKQSGRFAKLTTGY